LTRKPQAFGVTFAVDPQFGVFAPTHTRERPVPRAAGRSGAVNGIRVRGVDQDAVDRLTVNLCTASVITSVITDVMRRPSTVLINSGLRSICKKTNPNAAGEKIAKKE
jgi:hypothetical protein